MRCHSCSRLSLSLICSECRQLYLQPKLNIRKLKSGLEVISFYSYQDIEPFLLTKHHPYGWFIYRILAKETFKILSQLTSKTFVIPVDDYLSSSYSHTAILAKELKKYGYSPLYNSLQAKNRVSYSGKPLSFRLANSRDFEYRGPTSIDTILVDDIITTGTTLQEAYNTLKSFGVNVDFAYVLADVKLKK
ncbi:ComF family protein [Hydrogenimonas thermophila]|uniref:Competence protein ComFC n=1 Tax=Hydrogenimonas thermophila TaxID=223786 RepID=A0A1I5LV30_9BACT|nr:ComF family protein [Hydrogenimonas thermophila]WOE70448.1 ComF family protein [Hydrogenimonas thermophila]WOE72965.1 ComF family protein [Hydrogenimonas thermophila]SFP01082.1 competence protein ComFC [Hydrogenimonas thermophila]